MDEKKLTRGEFLGLLGGMTLALVLPHLSAFKKLARGSASARGAYSAGSYGGKGA